MLHVQLPTSEQMYMDLTVLRSNILLFHVRDGWSAQVGVWRGGREELQTGSYLQTMLPPRKGRHLVAIGLKVTSNDPAGKTSSVDGGIPSSHTRNTHLWGRGQGRLQRQPGRQTAEFWRWKKSTATCQSVAREALLVLGGRFLGRTTSWGAVWLKSTTKFCTEKVKKKWLFTAFSSSRQL